MNAGHQFTLYILCFSFSHWPHFDLIVRQVLLACRYKIVIPEKESVFEMFFNCDGKIYPKTLSPKVCPHHPF